MCIGNRKGKHETSLDLETETETKDGEMSRLETETVELPETRRRRDSRLALAKTGLIILTQNEWNLKYCWEGESIEGSKYCEDHVVG